MGRKSDCSKLRESYREKVQRTHLRREAVRERCLEDPVRGWVM